jgi:hypothetical protein
MRRRAVQLSQVMLPFGLIIAASVTILIVWQMVDPLQWDRDLLTGYLETHVWESYGQCSESNTLPYIIPLALLFLMVMLMTLSISWKMRTVQSDLSEAKWIFIAVFSHLQIWLVGIPVFLIVNEISRDASYLISMGLIFVFSNVFVVLVIWPKMLEDVGKNVFGVSDKATKRTTIHVDGGVTRVTGLQQPPGMISIASLSHIPASEIIHNAEMDKIHELEAQVNDLSAQLAQSKSLADAKYAPNEDNDDTDPTGDDERLLRDDEENSEKPSSWRVDAAGQIHRCLPNS